MRHHPLEAGILNYTLWVENYFVSSLKSSQSPSPLKSNTGTVWTPKKELKFLPRSSVAFMAASFRALINRWGQYMNVCEVSIQEKFFLQYHLDWQCTFMVADTKKRNFLLLSSEEELYTYQYKNDVESPGCVVNLVLIPAP